MGRRGMRVAVACLAVCLGLGGRLGRCSAARDDSNSLDVSGSVDVGDVPALLPPATHHRGHGRRLADIGRCNGLYIANKAEDEASGEDDFIMDDGTMSPNWNGQQVNMATADEEVREFYIWKTGQPIYFDNVTVFSANPFKDSKGAVIDPVLDDDGDQSIKKSSKPQGPIGEEDKSYTAHLRYGRCFRFGSPYVWITFEAWKSKSSKKTDGYDLLKSCGIRSSQCKGKVCLRFTILWAKQCPPQLAPMKGLTVGSSPNADDVARDGVTLPDFDPINPTYYILKDTTRSVFYLSLQRSANMEITIGKPSVQGFADNQLMITQSGTAGRGASLSPGGDKSMLEINFQCKPGVQASMQRISVGLDVCISDTPLSECNLQNSALIAAQSVEFSFIKYCLKNPHSSVGFIVFMVFILLTTASCILGCMYNYRVAGHRSVDIIPGIDMLRACIDALLHTSFFRSCPCPKSERMQYQTVSGVDEDEAEDGVNDSTVAYHRETKVKKPAVSIDMARRDKLFDEDEEDAFGDVIVDDEDMEGFYDNDDDDDIDLKGDELGV